MTTDTMPLRRVSTRLKRNDTSREEGRKRRKSTIVSQKNLILTCVYRVTIAKVTNGGAQQSAKMTKVLMTVKRWCKSSKSLQMPIKLCQREGPALLDKELSLKPQRLHDLKRTKRIRIKSTLLPNNRVVSLAKKDLKIWTSVASIKKTILTTEIKKY